MTVTEVAAQPAAPLPLDERISHRGPMRRWLISPEIGALIGAFVVWTFLWGNGETVRYCGHHVELARRGGALRHHGHGHRAVDDRR